jgi:hypothetical protein
MEAQGRKKKSELEEWHNTGVSEKKEHNLLFRYVV